MLVALGSLLLLTGCSDFVDQDQTSIVPEIALTLEPGHTIGQTFVSRHGGLNGVEVYLSPDAAVQGHVTLHLRDSPLSTADILTASHSVSAGQEGYYHFSFPSIVHSHTRYFYAFLEYDGPGKIRAPAGNLDSYSYGALYVDREPQKAQAVFRLRYDPISIAQDLLLMVWGWVTYGIASLSILFFSGYWIARQWVCHTADFTSTLIVSVCVALAAWMTFLVWCGMFIRLDAWSVKGLAGLSFLLGAYFFWKDRRIWQRKGFWTGYNPAYTIAFWCVTLLGVALRLFVGRGYIVLPGVDAYHHTLIVQLFTEQGGIPSTYEPYAPLVSFSYHFGFHSIAALFRWLFDADLLATTKITALVLNGSIAGIAGLLSERITGNRRAAVIAAALVGLVMVSPFCLLRWSRFTQTTGTLFLVASLWVVLARKEDRTAWVVPVLLTTGMIVSHYRVALFGAVCLAVLGGMHILQGDWKRIRELTLIGLFSLVLSAPWFVRAVWTQYDPYALRMTYPVLGDYNDLERVEEIVLSFATNLPVIYALILLAGIRLISREADRRLEWVFVVWGIILVGGGVLFPQITGRHFWELTTASLTLSIPVAILIGAWAHDVWDAMIGKLRLAVRGVLITASVGGIVSGVYYLPNVVYTAQPYIRPGDLVVMEWIKSNTPEDALFLVDSLQFDWSPGWVVGTDSGYWIPLLARRASTLPPMIYPLEWGDLSRLSGRVEITHRMWLGQKMDNASPDQILSRYGVTHVMAGYESNLIRSGAWLSDLGLEEVYRYDTGKILVVRNSADRSRRAAD